MQLKERSESNFQFTRVCKMFAASNKIKKKKSNTKEMNLITVCLLFLANIES